ncbi:hypothetical protein HNP29_000437 [Pseudomonas alcaligenes]|nr:hypothetical protein [Pseudomonas alcaligenes]
MSDVKLYTTNEAYALLPYGARVVSEADYDALREVAEGAESQAQYQRERAEHFQAERDQLRAELAAIRGQEPVAWMDEDGALHTTMESAHFRGAPVTALYALPPHQPDAVSVPRELLEWAVERWHAEVSQRPLANVHRRTLDDTWRQIITRLGGDHGLLCGPRHDDILSTRQAEEGE